MRTHDQRSSTVPINVLEKEVHSIGTVRSYSARLETYAYITRIRNTLGSDNVHAFRDHQNSNGIDDDDSPSSPEEHQPLPFLHIVTDKKNNGTMDHSTRVLSSSVLLTTTAYTSETLLHIPSPPSNEVQIVVIPPRFSSSSSTSANRIPPTNQTNHGGERFTLNHIGYLPYHPYDSTLQQYENYQDTVVQKNNTIPLSTTNDVLRTTIDPLIVYWLKGYDTSLVCTGQKGTGKTSLCFGSPALMINGRPSLLMTAITAGINHLKMCQRTAIAQHTHSSSSAGSCTPKISSLPVSSSIYQKLKTPSSSPFQLYLSVWGIPVANDTPIDLLSYITGGGTAPSSSSSTFFASSSLQHGSLHLLRIHIENENDAVKVLSQALLRAQSYTTIPNTDGTVTDNTTTGTTTSSVTPGSLLSIPSSMHIFVRLELFAPLLKESTHQYHWSTDSDINNIPQLVRTFTLVDLVGLPTRNGTDTPSLRIPSVPSSSLSPPSSPERLPVHKNTSKLSVLPMQYLSIGRQIKAIFSAQRNAGITLPSRYSDSNEDSSTTNNTPLLLQTERGQITYQQEMASPRHTNRKLIASSSSLSTVDSQKYPVFRSDQQNNRIDGAGLHIQHQRNNSPSNATAKAWYTDNDLSVTSRLPNNKEKRKDGTFFESYLATNEAGILASSLRDTALSRCLAPLLSGTVITKVIATVSNSFLDYQDTVQTLRLLQDMHSIVIKAVRCDIYSQIDNDKAQNMFLRVPYSLQMNPKLMTKESINKVTLNVNDWWTIHGKPISITLSTGKKDEGTIEVMNNQENRETEGKAKVGQEAGRIKNEKPAVQFVTNAKIGSSRLPKPPSLAASTAPVQRANKRHHPPSTSSTHYVSNAIIPPNAALPSTKLIVPKIETADPTSMPSSPRRTDPLNSTSSVLHASLLTVPLPSSSSSSISTSYPSSIPPRLSGNDPINGGTNSPFSLAYQQELVRIQELSTHKSRELTTLLWNGNPMVSTSIPNMDNVHSWDRYYKNGTDNHLNDTSTSSLSFTENANSRTSVAAPSSLRKMKEEKHSLPVSLKNESSSRSVPPSPISASTETLPRANIPITINDSTIQDGVQVSPPLPPPPKEEAVDHLQRRGSRYTPVPLGQVRSANPTYPPSIFPDTHTNNSHDNTVHSNAGSLSSNQTSIPRTDFVLVPYNEDTNNHDGRNVSNGSNNSLPVETNSIIPIIASSFMDDRKTTISATLSSSTEEHKTEPHANDSFSTTQIPELPKEEILITSSSPDAPLSILSPTSRTAITAYSIPTDKHNNNSDSQEGKPSCSDGKTPEQGISSPQRSSSRLSDIPEDIRPKVLLRMSPSAAAQVLLHSSSSSEDEKPKQSSSGRRSYTSSPSPRRSYASNRRSPRSTGSKLSPRASPTERLSRNSGKMNSTTDEDEDNGKNIRKDSRLDRPASVYRITSKPSSVRSSPAIEGTVLKTSTVIPSASDSVSIPSPVEVVEHSSANPTGKDTDSFPLTGSRNPPSSNAPVMYPQNENDVHPETTTTIVTDSTDTPDHAFDDENIDRPASSISFHSSSTQPELSDELIMNRAESSVRSRRTTAESEEEENRASDDHESLNGKSTVSSKHTSSDGSQGHAGDLDDTIHSKNQRFSTTTSPAIVNPAKPQRPSSVVMQPRTTPKSTTPILSTSGRERGSSSVSVTSIPPITESVKPSTSSLRTQGTKSSLSLSRPSSTIDRPDNTLDKETTEEAFPFTPRPTMGRVTPANNISEALFELARGENYIANMLSSYVQQASETETDVSVGGPKIATRNKHNVSDSSDETTDNDTMEANVTLDEEDSSDTSRRKIQPTLKPLPAIVQHHTSDKDTNNLESLPLVFPVIDTVDRPLPQLVIPSMDNLKIIDTDSENEDEKEVKIEENRNETIESHHKEAHAAEFGTNLSVLSTDDLDTDDILTEITDGLPSTDMPPLQNTTTESRNELTQSMLFQQSQIFVPPPPLLYTNPSTVRRESLTKGLQLAVISPLPPSPPPPPPLGTDAPPTSMSPILRHSPSREDKGIVTDLSLLSSLSTSTASEDGNRINNDENGILDTSVLQSFVSEENTNNDDDYALYPPHNGDDGTLTAVYAHISPARTDKPSRAYTQTVVKDDFDLANSKLSTLEGTRNGKEAAELAQLSSALISEYEIAYREVAATEELLHSLETAKEPKESILAFSSTTAPSIVNRVRRSVSPPSKGSRRIDLSPFRPSSTDGTTVEKEEEEEYVNPVLPTHTEELTSYPIGNNSGSTVSAPLFGLTSSSVSSSSVPYVTPVPSSALAAARALTSSLLSAPPASLTNSSLSLSSSLSTTPSRLVSSAFTPNSRSSPSLFIPKTEQQQRAESLLNTAASARRYANDLRLLSSQRISNSSSPSSSGSTNKNANLDESLINELLQPPLPERPTSVQRNIASSSRTTSTTTTTSRSGSTSSNRNSD